MSNNEEKDLRSCSTDENCGCGDEECFDEGCSCGCEDDDGEYINVENVAEIAIEENGTVHLLVVDDNGENPQEYAVDFPSFEQAEAWVKETFGEGIFEEEQ
ncbi:MULTISPECIES: hypothetical protein [Calditerrivibrio]|uniref:hypothetical protein n=1 Tax=Calditerrivibrio TaxID=545865 RepID=UPI003C7094F0